MAGNNAIWNHFLDKLLGLMVEQKRLVLSDINFLPSFLASLLGSSSDTLIVPQRIDQRCESNTSPLFNFSSIQNCAFNRIDLFFDIAIRMM